MVAPLRQYSSMFPDAKQDPGDEIPGIEILWMDHCYDGPLTGIAASRDRFFWFEGQLPFDFTYWPRRFVAYPLTPDQVAEERRRHERGDEPDDWRGFYEDFGAQPLPRYANRAPAGGSGSHHEPGCMTVACASDLCV